MRIQKPGLISYCFIGGPALLLMILFMGVCPSAASGKEQKALWQALKTGEAFAIMRHAIAPGTGDPDQFKIGDCSTQRNLSDQGRKQARRAGEILRLNGVKTALVYSSQWCRCRETAKLLTLGPVQDLPALNSFFEAYERRAKQTRQLKSWLQARARTGPLVLITHQVNISALTGRGTRSGEIVFVKPGSKGNYSVLGSIVP